MKARTGDRRVVDRQEASAGAVRGVATRERTIGIPRAKWPERHLEVIDGEGRLTDDAAEELSLSPEERAALQEIFAAMAARMAKLDAERATDRSTGSAVILEVPPLDPLVAAQERVDFVVTLARIVGQDWAACLVEAGRDNLDVTIGGMGSVNRVVMLEKQEPAPDGTALWNASVMASDRSKQEDMTETSMKLAANRVVSRSWHSGPIPPCLAHLVPQN